MIDCIDFGDMKITYDNLTKLKQYEREFAQWVLQYNLEVAKLHEEVRRHDYYVSVDAMGRSKEAEDGS
jgi:hypothetical protein